MRIAYLSGAYISSRGANSVHVMCMCQALAQLGHNVTLYSRPGDIDVKDDFVFYGVNPTFVLSKQSRPQVRILGAFWNALRTRDAVAGAEKPDLIYAREVWALFLATNLGVPFIFESHWLPRNAIQRAAEKRLLQHPLFRRVVFISEALRRKYLEMFPWLDRRKTLVAHDAANVPISATDNGMAMSDRKTALQVGYIGSFHVGCGVDLIEKIANLLPNNEFHVVGGSSKEVETWVKRAKYLENLRFHGFVPPKDLLSIYKNLDVVMAPYQSDTPHIGWVSPMKLFEYMANGKAIVCSDFPVLREVIEHGENGLLVPSNCSESWAKAIAELEQNIKLRQKLGNAGRESVKCYYSWYRRAERVLDGL